MQPVGGVFTLVGARHHSTMAACSALTGPCLVYMQPTACFPPKPLNQPLLLHSPPPHQHPQGQAGFEQMLLKRVTSAQLAAKKEDDDAEEVS